LFLKGEGDKITKFLNPLPYYGFAISEELKYFYPDL
jgi:hypothetical protein